MTDGIGRIFGGNGYNVGGYTQRKSEEENTQTSAQAPAQNYEETQVDPSKVMDFLSANNFFIAPVETKPLGQLDAATQSRVEGYMESFEIIYDVIVKEFGEALAPDVMDMAMDHLMGMAA